MSGDVEFSHSLGHKPSFGPTVESPDSGRWNSRFRWHLARQRIQRTLAPVVVATDAASRSFKTRLSQFAKVDVYARISRTGSANARTGDFEGWVKGVTLGSLNVKLVVDHVLDQ